MGPLSSDELLSAFLESSTHAVLVVDRTGTIVVASRRAEEPFGYAPSELLGASVEALIPEPFRSAHVRDRNAYERAPKTRAMGIGLDLTGRRRDGTQFPVEIGLSRFNTKAGEFTVAFVSDISQRKALEEQLLQAQKMEAVGRLADGIAHDFNNMLTVISGFASMALNGVPQENPARNDIEEIIRAAAQAAELSRRLLAFSRRQVTKPRVINVNAVVRDLERMLRHLVRDDIQMSLQLGPDVGNIHADPIHIEQALTNLVVNARDAMPGGGRIVLETANVQLDHLGVLPQGGAQAGPFVMIAVSDNGQGIDSAAREHLFEPFFTTKPKGKGTGLGLATVYSIVKKLGGEIWLQSELGRGATFKLFFPAVDEPVTEDLPEPVRAVEPARGATVLLVEDEPALRTLTAKMLEQLGFAVLTAADGSEALQAAKTHSGRIALLLTDVVLPGISGSQVAEMVREVDPNVKVLYLSGYAEHTVRQHGVLPKRPNFLPKPFSRELLSERIRAILS